MGLGQFKTSICSAWFELSRPPELLIDGSGPRSDMIDHGPASRPACTGRTEQTSDIANRYSHPDHPLLWLPGQCQQWLNSIIVSIRAACDWLLWGRSGHWRDSLCLPPACDPRCHVGGARFWLLQRAPDLLVALRTDIRWWRRPVVTCLLCL